MITAQTTQFICGVLLVLIGTFLWKGQEVCAAIGVPYRLGLGILSLAVFLVFSWALKNTDWTRAKRERDQYLHELEERDRKRILDDD